MIVALNLWEKLVRVSLSTYELRSCDSPSITMNGGKEKGKET